MNTEDRLARMLREKADSMIARSLPIEAVEVRGEAAAQKRRRRLAALTAAGAVAAVLAVGAGAVYATSLRNSADSGPSSTTTSAPVKSYSNSFASTPQLAIDPSSGPAGTQVTITVSDCSDPSGENHALSYNDGDLPGDSAASDAHIHQIPAQLTGGAVKTTFTIPTSRVGTRTFFLQCPAGVVTAPFIVTGGSH